MLHEWRAVLYGKNREGQTFDRDAFIKNGLIPKAPEVALEESVYAIKLMSEDAMAQTAARARFEALLAQLKLLQFEQPALERRVIALEREGTREVRRASAVDRNIAFGCLAVVLLLTGIVAWLLQRFL